MKAVGFGLLSSASVVAGRFWVWFELPFLICSLAFTFALFGFSFGLLSWLLFWQTWRVKRLVYVALQNSVLGLALLVSAFISTGGDNDWLLLGGVFWHLLTTGSFFVWRVALQFWLLLLWLLGTNM